MVLPFRGILLLKKLCNQPTKSGNHMSFLSGLANPYNTTGGRDINGNVHGQPVTQPINAYSPSAPPRRMVINGVNQFDCYKIYDKMELEMHVICMLVSLNK